MSEEMQVNLAEYDKGNMFGPGGRIYSLMYAREATENGSLAIGIEAKDGVVLLAEKRVRKLVKSESVKRVSEVDDHIGMVSSGMLGDARKLLNIARVVAQNNRALYDEPIEVKSLAKTLCDEMQHYTQVVGVRPFGAALLIAGVCDGESYLIQTDVSGTLLVCQATAIGGGNKEAMHILEEHYDENMTLEQATIFGLEILHNVVENINLDNVSVAFVENKTEMLRVLDSGEIRLFIDRMEG